MEASSNFHLITSKSYSVITRVPNKSREFQFLITFFFLSRKKVLIIWLMTERALAASVSPVATSKATTSVCRNEMIDRLACQPDNGQHEPVNRVNTSQRLEMLRKAMTLSKVDAYIVTGDDAHQVFHSERRRASLPNML